jgi:transposase
LKVTDGPLGYDITEAQRRLGNVSRNTIYRAVNRSELELVKIGTRSIITARSVDALLNRNAPLKAVA